MRVDYRIRSEIRAIKRLTDWFLLWLKWRRDFLEEIEKNLLENAKGGKK